MFKVDVLDGPLAGTEVETESESILYTDYKGVKYAYNLADKFPGSPFLTDYKSGLLTHPVNMWKKLGKYVGPPQSVFTTGDKALLNPYSGVACWAHSPWHPVSKFGLKHIVAKNDKPKAKKVKIATTADGWQSIGTGKVTISNANPGVINYAVGPNTKIVYNVMKTSNNTKAQLDEQYLEEMKKKHQEQKAIQFAQLYGAGKQAPVEPKAFPAYMKQTYQPYTGWAQPTKLYDHGEFPEMFDYVTHSVSKSTDMKKASTSTRLTATTIFSSICQWKPKWTLAHAFASTST